MTTVQDISNANPTAEFATLADLIQDTIFGKGVGYGAISLTPDKFAMRSNHDSCWRSDGLRDLNKAHSDAFKALRKRVPESPIHESNRIELVQWVGVTYTTDPSNSTRKTLTGITPLTQLDGRHKS